MNDNTLAYDSMPTKPKAHRLAFATLLTGIAGTLSASCAFSNGWFSTLWLERYFGQGALLLIFFFGPTMITAVPAALWLFVKFHHPRTTGGAGYIVGGFAATLPYFVYMILLAISRWPTC